MNRTNQRLLLALGAVAAALLAASSGCELITAVDRTQIVGEGGGGGAATGSETGSVTETSSASTTSPSGASSGVP